MLTFHRACWIGWPTAGPFSIALTYLLRQQMGKPAALRADAISAWAAALDQPNGSSSPPGPLRGLKAVREPFAGAATGAGGAGGK